MNARKYIINSVKYTHQFNNPVYNENINEGAVDISYRCNEVESNNLDGYDKIDTYDHLGNRNFDETYSETYNETYSELNNSSEL